MYEVNRKMVFSFLNVGLGFAGMQNFCEVMGMEGLTEKTHRSHVAAIHRHGLDFKTDMLEDSAQRVRLAHGKKSGVLDLAVSFDGSWQKRGHTSKHGIGAVIEATTGLVLDFHVMSSFCQVCKTIRINFYVIPSASFHFLCYTYCHIKAHNSHDSFCNEVIVLFLANGTLM